MIDDYGDCDESDVETVDSDDNEIKFVGSKRRFKYTTFEDNSEEVNEDVDGKESSIYGVFAEHDRRSKSKQFSSKPIFVKASSEQTEHPSLEEDQKSSISGREEETVAKSSADDDSAKAERKLRKDQEQANQDFLALLNKGKGRKRSRINFECEGPVEDALPNKGLGFSDDTTNSDVACSDNISFHKSTEDMTASEPSSLSREEQSSDKIGGSQFEFQSSKPPSRTKSNLGKWEKHTKGIGMKLLSKMGYSGSGGLGSKRRRATAGDEQVNLATGISRPVEVVVRPQNLGLGFGNFKEATKLKVNRQINAEIRGEKIPENTQMAETKAVAGSSHYSSSLPSTEEIMSKKSWRRGAKQMASRKGEKLKIIPFTDIIKDKQTKGIIDMRGPASKSEEIPLGEELLFNTSMLLNNYESKVRAAAHFLQTSKQKVKSLQSDLDHMEKRKKSGMERVSKMKSVLQVVDSIDDMIASVDPELTSKTQALLHKLRDELNEDDKMNLQFDKVLVPSLLSPLIDNCLDSWKPLNDAPEKTKTIIKSLMKLGSEIDDLEAAKERRISIFSREILPKVKSAFESTKWNPVVGVNEAITLYETVLNAAEQSLLTKEKYDTDQSGVFSSVDVDEEMLSDLIPRELLRETIFPKLMRCLQEWKAEVDFELNIQNSLESWLLPWIPYLMHPVILTQLASDLRRKLRSTLSLLNREMMNHGDFLCTGMAILKPWRTLLKQDVIYELTSKYLTPRFKKAFSSLDIIPDTINQNWMTVDSILSVYNAKLMDDLEFSSLLEGELLPVWIHELQKLLNSKKVENIDDVASFYKAWKLRLFTTDQSLPSYQLLRADDVICRIFYSGLIMIDATFNKGKPQEITPELVAASCRRRNYNSVFNRRRQEKKDKNEDVLNAVLSKDTMEFQKEVLSRRHGDTATFREVVEEFCLQESMTFRPKTGGRERTIDGKPIFLVEKVPIYIDANVIFAKESGEWNPISLDQLTSMAKSNN